MSGELSVYVSGEGDFEMTTDCAWRIAIDTPNNGSGIVVTVMDGGPKIEVNGEEIWREPSPHPHEGLPLRR